MDHRRLSGGAEPERTGSRDRHLEKLSSVTLMATAETQRWAEPIVARLATEFWRLRRRVEQSNDPVDAGVKDSVARIDDVFAEHGVHAVDHDGELYDHGLQVEVLHERPGEGALVILETVRPTITLAGRVVQHGQVVIGPKNDLQQDAV